MLKKKKKIIIIIITTTSEIMNSKYWKQSDTRAGSVTGMTLDTMSKKYTASVEREDRNEESI